MTRASFLLIISVCLSVLVRADEPVSCNLKESRSAIYYRDISHAKFGDVVDIKEELKGILLEHTRDVERIAKWNKKLSGPDHDYIPVLVNLLNQNAGLYYEFSCFWALHKEGDIVRKFTDYETMVFRDGYGLFRGGKLVAYFYSGIGVV